MNFVTHQLTGIVLSLSFMKITGDTSLVPLAVASIGSLIPDIDEPRSKAGQKVPVVSGFLKSTLGHRGGTHSFFMMFIFTLLFIGLLYYFKFPLYLFIYFVLGYVSHLFMDLLTVAGVPLFWPFSKVRFRISNIKVQSRKIITSSGYKFMPSRTERAIQIILCIMLFFLCIDYFWFSIGDLMYIKF